MMDTPYEKLVDLIRKLNHDARAPLGSIISTSEMLSQGSYDGLTPKQVRANDRIQRNSQRVLMMLDDFSTYVKADAKQIELFPRSFDPRECVSSWLSQIMPTAEKKGLTVHATTHEAVPALLIGDMAVISRAVMPVIWNALTFSSEGEIRIEATWAQDSRWVLSIQDSGPGVMSENIPHLFEPFWRGPERPTVITAGVGLGLALSFVLTQIMDGIVCLDRTSTAGSVFRLEFPLSLPPVL